MSTNQRSFWSTIPGLITGLAGILTGIVGLATLLIQIGVIGGDNGDSPATTRPGATATPGAGDSQSDGAGTETTVGRPGFTVAPTRLRLTSGDKSGEVTVSNTGGAAFTLVTEITGSGEDQFTVRRGSCGAEVPRRGSCTMTVEFSGGLAATAELVVTVRGASPSRQTVDLEGSLL